MTAKPTPRRRRLWGALGAWLCAAALLAGMPTALAESRTQTAALSPDDVAAINRIERYLNDIKTMRGRFVQVSSNGAYAEGDVYLDRPGRMRFEYDPPTPVLIIANGLSLLYYDKELKEATFLPLWETPLWFLIRKEVRFDDNVDIVGIEEALGTLRITLRDPDSPDGGEVTLVFSDEPLALRKWELIDPQGIQTQVSLVNLVFGVEVDPELFKSGNLEVWHGGKARDQ
ncbi:MAG: outer membrane lipoprotein carrier protein LolA [Kiloniellaceae bacterium]|nr:outer membrane lipoprotein carrier protein LolA [Kiloniellaceae bacterium]